MPSIDSSFSMKAASGACSVADHASYFSAGKAIIIYHEKKEKKRIRSTLSVACVYPHYARAYYLKIKTSSTDNTLNGGDAVNSLDFFQDFVSGLLSCNKRCLVFVCRPLAAPFACNGIKLYSFSNHGHLDGGNTQHRAKAVIGWWDKEGILSKE
jgi:hypothetical protein